MRERRDDWKEMNWGEVKREMYSSFHCKEPHTYMNTFRLLSFAFSSGQFHVFFFFFSSKQGSAKAHSTKPLSRSFFKLFFSIDRGLQKDKMILSYASFPQVFVCLVVIYLLGKVKAMQSRAEWQPSLTKKNSNKNKKWMEKGVLFKIFIN